MSFCDKINNSAIVYAFEWGWKSDGHPSKLEKNRKTRLEHSFANCDSSPTPAKSEAVEYLQVGKTAIRYSIACTIFVYL